MGIRSWNLVRKNFIGLFQKKKMYPARTVESIAIFTSWNSKYFHSIPLEIFIAISSNREFQFFSGYFLWLNFKYDEYPNKIHQLGK